MKKNVLFFCCTLFGFATLNAQQCCGWDVSADYLYWKPNRCNLDYAVPIVTQITPNERYIFDGDVSSVDPGYCSGFRVHVVKDFRCFDVGLRYEHFHAHYRDSSSAPGLGLMPTRSIGSNDLQDYRANSADGRYTLYYDVIDIEFGYNFCTCGIAFRPFGGFKIALFDQKFQANYFSSGASTYDVAQWQSELSEDAEGLYVGLELRKELCLCTELFGSLSAGILAADGCFTAANEEDFNFNDTSDEVGTFGIGNFNFIVGLARVFDCFCNAELAIGYEMHLWTNTRAFIPPEPDISTFFGVDSLGVDGLFVRVNLPF